MSDEQTQDEVQLRLLKLLVKEPNVSQRDLARAAGISLGKLNYCLKALIDVGLVKVNNFTRSTNKRKYAYLITPKGMAEKTRITLRFLEYKQRQYEKLKQEIEMLKNEVDWHKGKE